MWKLKNHSVEPLSRGFEPLCLYSALSFGGTWNLWVRNVDVEPREPESLCGTVVEQGTFMEPWNLGEPELYVEALWTLEPFESWGTWTFKAVTFMWNLGEPGSRFRAAAPNLPETLLEEPQAVQAVGEKWTIFL